MSIIENLKENYPYLYYGITSIIIIFFMVTIFYGLIIKPRKVKVEMKAKLDQAVQGTPTPGGLIKKQVTTVKKIGGKSAALVLKSAQTVGQHVATIKGKVIQIGKGFDDLPPEEQEKAKRCYEDPNLDGCQF